MNKDLVCAGPQFLLHPSRAHQAGCPRCNPTKTVPELNAASAAVTSKGHLNCPFCDGKDIRSHHRGHPTAGEWVIECHNCSCELTGFASELDAWVKWDTRSGHETTGYPGDSVSRVLAEMTEAAQAARAHQRDSVYLFVEQWIGRLQILTGQQSSEKASTDRAVVEANALADAHRMYEAEHGHPFPQKP